MVILNGHMLNWSIFLLVLKKKEKSIHTSLIRCRNMTKNQKWCVVVFILKSLSDLKMCYFQSIFSNNIEWMHFELTNFWLFLKKMEKSIHTSLIRCLNMGKNKKWCVVVFSLKSLSNLKMCYFQWILSDDMEWIHFELMIFLSISE
jgi:hypothetical protein